MKYEIVQSDETEELAAEVRELMAKGWQPLGGIAVSNYVFTDRDDSSVSCRNWYLQAMTLTEV